MPSSWARAAPSVYPSAATPKGLIMEEEKVSEERSSDTHIDTDWLASIMKKVSAASTKHQNETPHTIYMVPDDIRRHDADAYEPMVVHIGPYHAAQRPRSMEEYKWRCVHKLIERKQVASPDPDLLKKCLQAIVASVAAIRSRYSDWERKHSIESDDELATMMLLDGCFILHRLLGHDRTDESQFFKKLYVSPALGRLWIWDLVSYDLLLLENQIPFFVITKLLNILRTEADKGIALVTQALKLFRHLHPCRMTDSEIISISRFCDERNVHHLLHLLYISIDLPHAMVPASQERQPQASSQEDHTRSDWIPSAMELQAAGISFRKGKEAKSLLDINFSGHDGVLEIPPLEIHDYSTRLFRNLIAFEQCYPDTRSRIIIYVIFMSCVINTPNDLRLLHLNRILTDRTNSEKGALLFFARLGNQIHYPSDRNYLKNVFIEVAKYHGSTLHQWRAALVRKYFNNPWAAVSVVAAIVLFGLTVAQTVLAA